jgi:hypothetical protein
MNEITDEGINRNHAFHFEFAQRYVNRPLARAYGMQAVIRDVNRAGSTNSDRCLSGGSFQAQL